MTALPDIPRLYTALAEWLAVVLYTQSRPPRFARKITLAASGMLAVMLGVFLEATGEVPIAWWVPCMGIAVGMQYLYLWITREENWLEAAYDCARSFILAEFAASVEWQLHCTIFPQHGGGEPMALFLLLLVYSGLFGVMYGLERKRPPPDRASGRQQYGGSGGRRHGGDGLFREQPELPERGSDHERFLHPDAGGFLRRSDPDR